MSSKQARGTKRTCQSNECGIRFYDLNRKPVSCPICGTIYEIASSPVAISAATEEKALRKPKKPEYVAPKVVAEDAPEAEGEEVLADIEAGDDDVAPEAGDETFLEEEEEEGGNVGAIVPVPEGEEEV